MKNKNINSDVKQSKKKSHPFWSFFWLTFLVVSLWYAWYSFYAPSNDVVWTNDVVSAKQTAKYSDKNIMIFFTGEWCSPCRIMKRQVFADNEAIKSIHSKVVPVEINIDHPDSKNLVKQFNIGATPTTIFIDSQGKVIDYAIGRIEKTEFLGMLDKQGEFLEYH
ncbi:thioredoxin family protein [Flagellimonas sp.]|uniref:thioredoxin family protein n=1 Tax=Flagellimonas sp. TaxID=2058762 RepID=UPI003BA8A65C